MLAAIVVVLGTLFGLEFAVPAIFLISIAIPSILAACFLRRWPVRNICANAAIFTLAALSASFSHVGPMHAGIAPIMSSRSEHMGLLGVVSYEPVCYEKRGRVGSRSCYFGLDVKAVHRSGDWETVSDRVFVRMTVPEGRPPISYGDMLEVYGVLTSESDGNSFGAGGKGLTFRTVAGEGDIVSRGNGSKLISFCLKLRSAAAAVLDNGLDEHPREAGLLKALLLGYREGLASDVYDKFVATGTIHILAISGLHVGLIAGFIIFILRWIGIPRTRWYILLIPLLAVYTIGTGLRASAIRACLMAVVYWLAPPFKRRPDAMCALALAAIIILILSPQQIMDLGFQFSFAIVAGIILILPILNRLGLRFVEPDPLRVQSEAKLVVWLRRGLRAFYFLVAVTFAAWLISFPLIMVYGNILSPIALLGNLFVVPLVTVVVAIGATTLLLGSFIPLLAFILSSLNRIFLTILLDFVKILSEAPLGHIYAESPPGWFIPIYYLLLWRVFGARRRYERVLAIAAIPLFVVGYLIACNLQDTEIHIEDTGRCTVALMDFKGSSEMLVNTGSRYFGRNLRQWLRGRGVNRLEDLILTQVDSDHAGGVLQLMERVKVGRIWIPDYTSRSPIYSALIRSASEKGIEIVRHSAGDPISLPDGFEIEFFNPRAALESRNTRQSAFIFRLARAGKAILFVGSDRIPSGFFEQAKDIAAPIWVLDEYCVDDSVAPHVFMYQPETIVFGGELKPEIESNTNAWMLQQKGSFIHSF